MSSPLNRRTLLRAGTATTTALGLTAAMAPAADAARHRAVIDHRSVTLWIERYLHAWSTKDADAAVRLFTHDAVYQAVPGVADQTFQGRDAIRAYWTRVTAGQSDLSALHGIPVVDGHRATVELWVMLRAAGANPSGDDWITLIETNVLSFTPEGRCSRNVEYWYLQPGRLTPPPGWGANA